MKKLVFLSLLFIFLACASNNTSESNDKIDKNGKDFAKAPLQEQIHDYSLVVLGNVQDAGSPHIGCQKSCCLSLFQTPDPTRMVVSLGLIDHPDQKQYLFEASPDMSRQIELLNQTAGVELNKMPDGVFLTHAHIGHYTGLMYFGREAKGASKVPVYAMPRMTEFLQTSGPWSQLVDLQNIELKRLDHGAIAKLGKGLSITPFTVPHRDEFSETVGFQIEGPNARALFIPDIDKWDKWADDISLAIAGVDFAFLDATFFDGDELPNRDISEIPHPFVIESMALFENLSAGEKDKIYFIHLNHTNPLLNQDSKQSKLVEEKGFHVARLGDIFKL